MTLDHKLRVAVAGIWDPKERVEVMVKLMADPDLLASEFNQKVATFRRKPLKKVG